MRCLFKYQEGREEVTNHGRFEDKAFSVVGIFSSRYVSLSFSICYMDARS